MKQFNKEMKKYTRRNSDGSDDIMVGNMVIEDSSSDDEEVSSPTLMVPERFHRRPSNARPRGESNAAKQLPPPIKTIDYAQRSASPSPSEPNSVDAFATRGRGESSTADKGQTPTVAFPSRHSSRSRSRSPSVPTSVNAFASNRRRGRSGTASSQIPSELASLRRTASRRLSHDSDHEHVNSGDEAGKPEEDVCFPMSQENDRWKIDFDEMEEFVIEQNQPRGRSTRECGRRRKMSVCSTINNGYSRTPPSMMYNGAGDECAIEDDDTSYPLDKKDSDRYSMPESNSRLANQPDRFSFFSSELDATVHTSQFGDIVMEGESFRDLFRGGSTVWWLDVLNPTEAEMKMLSRAFGLHPLTTEDIRVQETREKVELFRQYYFVCFRSFVQKKSSEDFMEPINIYLVVFREGVLSFQFTPSPHSANVRRRIRQLRDYVALSSDWICYALMYVNLGDVSFGKVL